MSLRRPALLIVPPLLLVLALAVVWALSGLSTPLGGAGARGSTARDRVVVPLAADEQQLQKDVRGSDPAGVLEFFRKRTLSEDERRQAAEWVRQLGSESFAERDAAAAHLLTRGRPVAGLLRRALGDADPERAGQVRHCLRELDRVATPGLLASAVKFVADHKPDAAAAVLLAYLPFADDDELAAAVRTALLAVAVRDGKVDEAVVKGLDDPDPLRRAAAVEVLARAKAGRGADGVRRLLRDPESGVRLAVALGLVGAKEKDAVPVLIELLAELPEADQWRVEAVLTQLAGDQSPATAPGTDAESRRRCHDAWAGWWRDHGETLDLDKVPAPGEAQGYLVLAEMSLQTLMGRVREVGPGRRVRWEIPDLDYPLAVEMVGDDHVLIAEYKAKRVTERDLKGGVLWQFDAPGPVVAAQRLANGNTFVATRNRLLEVDPSGKEVFTHPRPVRDVCAARTFPNGQRVLVTPEGVCVRLDASGTEVKRFPVGAPVLGAGIDVLPTQRVIVPEFSANRVTEYDADGGVVWRATVEGPVSVVRLPDGHTLVACRRESRSSSLLYVAVELDRDGKEISQVQAEDALLQVRRH
jgi:HEAT repeats/PQQ-like domain